MRKTVRYNPLVIQPSLLAPPASGKTASWSLLPRFLLLNAGLVLYGLGLSAMIRANVGLAPWDAFHVGLANVIPWLSIGRASIVVGLVFQFVAARFLSMPIGLGSVFNLVLIGVYIDLIRPRLPVPASDLAAWALFASGVGLVGLATGTYIASGFGAGPRDSLVLGLARKTGRPVKHWRTAIEIAVLLAGFLLGARVGWGTLVFACAAGPAMSAGLRLYGLRR